ncbi:MAG: hypothetical protein ACLSDH_02170 [Bacilli bacterium]
MDNLNYNQKNFQKIVGSFLLLVMFSVCIIQSMFYFKTSDSLFTKNNIYVETLKDDDTIKLSFNNLFAPSNEVLLLKNFCDGEFHYTISDLKSGNELLNFDSTADITASGKATKNTNMCAAVGSFVWAVATGGNVAAALASAFGAAAGLISEGTLTAMLGLIAESGIASIGAVIGLLSATEAIVVALGVGGLA